MPRSPQRFDYSEVQEYVPLEFDENFESEVEQRLNLDELSDYDPEDARIKRQVACNQIRHALSSHRPSVEAMDRALRPANVSAQAKTLIKPIEKLSERIDQLSTDTRKDLKKNGSDLERVRAALFGLLQAANEVSTTWKESRHRTPKVAIRHTVAALCKTFDRYAYTQGCEAAEVRGDKKEFVTWALRLANIEVPKHLSRLMQ